MTNTSISRTFRRHLVIGLAALTAFSSFAGSAVAVKADPMYDTSALEAYLNTAEAKANENAVVEETQNEEKQPVENEAIVLTVDENNQIIGENEGTAWFVDENGTLNLNNGYKFAFNGDVSNMNMVCSGEITEGHFVNVTLNLTENAVISNAAFDDSEIYYTAGAVINENVVLNNTNLIDATVTNPEEAVTAEAE